MTSLVVHFIPYDGIGGVEAAARSLASANYQHFRFQKYFLASRSDFQTLQPSDRSGSCTSVNHPFNWLQAVFWLHRSRPKLLIASLWRCYVITILHKILHPRCRIVCFLHSDHAAHWIDWLLALVAMALATEIWTDSKSTLLARVPLRLQRKSRVISFLIQHLFPVTREKATPHFLFWGRLSAEKGLDKALNIINELKRDVSGIQFHIVGPDLGEQLRLERLVRRLGLGQSVRFLGPKTHQEIAYLVLNSSFYLQTSLFEGMSISVIEAMQFGLVPVVSPVGEIARYCQDGMNAIFVSNGEYKDVVLRIKQLLDDQDLYLSIRKNAIRTWADKSIYGDDFLSSCCEVLQLKKA